MKRETFFVIPFCFCFYFCFSVYYSYSRDFCHLLFLYTLLKHKIIIHVKKSSPPRAEKILTNTQNAEWENEFPRLAINAALLLSTFLILAPTSDGFSRDNSCQLRSVMCQIKLRGYAGDDKKVNVSRWKWADVAVNKRVKFSSMCICVYIKMERKIWRKKV